MSYDYSWIKIESWHAVIEHEGGVVRTVCGRRVDLDVHRNAQFAAELGSEKSCENCLRLITREHEAPDLEG